MRTLGLLLLAIFIPAFAHAAEPPALTTYTISHDAIYPTASADSGLATTTAIDVAFSEPVKVSIKIVSASGTSAKSLYSSSSVTNPTPKIWDGVNTAGTRVDTGLYTIVIMATSTATSQTLIDSSKTITVASPSAPMPPADSSDTTETEEDSVSVSSDSGSPEYLPIPMLRLVTSGDRTISSGADVSFVASVYDGKGNRRDDAVVTWSFGDGMRRVGAKVLHAYYEPGDYLAIVHATTADGGDVMKEVVVTVKQAGITIASILPRGITLANSDLRTLDLSLWRLSMGGQEFKIPEDTHVLAGRAILFPAQVIQLPMADSASLLYPSGEVAAVYPAPIKSASPGEQPLASVASYKKVQAVEPIISTATNGQAHDEPVIAPSAVSATETAEGAALLAVSPLKTVLSSPWTLGFLGTILLAGGAFIFI